MKTAIAIFVKTPHLSPLKTRLAAGIGTKKALEFYDLSIKAVEKNVKSVDAEGIWAIHEPEALNDPLWSGLKAIQSGEGDIGGRQHHVYETLLKDYDSVILIGSDSPQTSPDILNEAIKALESYDFVIGPANDGGYYLFGGKMSLGREIWESVPWSVETTRDCLEAGLLSKPYHVPTLTDVDTEFDLPEILKEMPEHKSTEQEAVVQWIEKVIN